MGIILELILHKKEYLNVQETYEKALNLMGVWALKPPDQQHARRVKLS